MQDSPLFEIPESQLNLQHDNIYTINASQYNAIQESYNRFPLPNDILFPWLHGVDGLSNQQNLFFGVRRCIPPNYRGLVVVHGNEEEHVSRLVGSVSPSQLLSDTGEFIANTETSINLRNFANQIARFSTLCDIIVYGSKAESLAIMISNAQQNLYKEREYQLQAVKNSGGKRAIENANHILYKTIIINEDFSVFENDFPNLVMFDAVGVPKNTLNFWDLENIEMRKMSEASEVTPNVWMGNTQDAPISIQEIKEGGGSGNGIETDDDDDDDDFFMQNNDNPHQFSICIEAHDLADMPLPSTLTLASETLDDKQSEIIHFDMYSTGVPQERTEFEAFYSRLISLLTFMQEQADKGRRILIHCTDGYTETSLLALSWIMFNQKMNLPEAYLYLQKKRSFFVYAANIPTLRRIEHLLSGDELMEPLPKRKKSQQYDDHQTIQLLKVTSINDISSSDDSDDSDMESSPWINSSQHRVLHGDKYINNISNNNNSSAEGQVYRQLQLSPTKEESRLYPWFFSPRFEGSFPSRILPFLYLGNLNHATNPDMLKTLGITHVVSVGENADLNKDDFKLLFLDNLYDDGIDSIHNRIDSVMDFVEDARKSNSICLIHCRVGVSRSAAITICYVMKHLKYTLVEAYLFVRARRLNVIIQPNLKFMYELLQLEQRETGNTTISWPVLCNEVSNLNFNYRDT